MLNNPPPQPNNPTDLEREALVKHTLREENRLEDFKYINKLLSPPPDITTLAPLGSCKGKKIGIIGGGAAGLSAAFELKKLGADITVFEALKDRIGGRMYTYYFDKERDLYGELGAMRVPVSHGTTWHYINLFNLDTRPFIQQNENGYIYAKNIRVRNDPEGKNVMEKIYPYFNLTPYERNTPWMDLLNYVLETPIKSMPPHIRKEISQILPKYSPQIIYWDKFNLRQLQEYFCLSESAIQMLSSVSTFGTSFFYYATTDLLNEIYTVAFAYVYEIIGGMSNLPMAFHDALTDNNLDSYGAIPTELLGKVKIHKGTPVNGIFYNYEYDKVTLRYKELDLEDNQKYQDFDYIVCAIPFSVLRTIETFPQFSNTKMQAIKELGYCTSQKTLLLCEERFWEKGGPDERILGGGSFTDLPILSTWYPSDFKTDKEAGVLMASYNFDSDAIRLGNLPKDVRFERVKRQVAEVHGLPLDYIDDIVTDYKTIQWYHHPWSLGAFSFFKPEQKRLFSYNVTLPEYNNKVFFAGEHISLNHAWVNGALETGMKAANEIALVVNNKYPYDIKR